MLVFTSNGLGNCREQATVLFRYVLISIFYLSPIADAAYLLTVVGKPTIMMSAIVAINIDTFECHKISGYGEVTILL
jgi:hypothetical protein